MNLKDIKINKNGFATCKARNWKYKGDKGTWIKIDKKNATIKYADNGIISESYYDKMIEMCKVFGVNFDSMKPGDLVTCNIKKEIKL